MTPSLAPKQREARITVSNASNIAGAVSNASNRTWSLYKRPMLPTLPRVCTYWAWVDPDGIVKYARCTAAWGWQAPDISILVGMTRKQMFSFMGVGWRKAKHTMSDTQMSQGWLL